MIIVYVANIKLNPFYRHFTSHHYAATTHVKCLCAKPLDAAVVGQELTVKIKV